MREEGEGGGGGGGEDIKNIRRRNRYFTRQVQKINRKGENKGRGENKIEGEGGGESKEGEANLFIFKYFFQFK